MNIFIPELYDQIASLVPQFDLINLCRVNKQFNRLTTNRLYHSVTIDYNFTQFDVEYQNDATTYIKSKFSFLSFVKSCNENPTLINHIVEFNVKNLPLEFYDFENYLIEDNDDQNYNKFNNKNLCLLKMGQNLQKIDIHKEVSFKFLNEIILNNFSLNNLKTLQLNINVYSTFKSLGKIIQSKKIFKQLETLSIGPFTSNEQLKHLLELVEENSKVMKNLKIRGQGKFISLSDLIGANITHLNVKSNEVLFSKISKFENLTSLSLVQINVDLDKLITIASNVDLFKNLNFLELSEISVISSGLLGKSILHVLFDNCQNISLDVLKLDIRQTNQDQIPEFFVERIRDNSIKQLDIVIRCNNLQSESVDSLMDRYINKALISQSKSLAKLSLEVKSERTSLNIDERSLLKILNTKFPKIESLRIETHFANILKNKNLLVQNFPRLDKLWIVGSKAVPMHFGLGSMFPGVYDKWWRIIHFPANLMENIDKDYSLQYIKVDDCLFQIQNGNSNDDSNNGVHPKDSIDDWFDDMSRVKFKV